jgi:hypothetical protein
VGVRRWSIASCDNSCAESEDISNGAESTSNVLRDWNGIQGQNGFDAALRGHVLIFVQRDGRHGRKILFTEVG